MPHSLTLDSFLPPVQELLTEAGWYPGRDGLAGVRLPEDIEYPPPIRGLLASFAGLHVGYDGPGISVIRSPVVFEPWIGNEENEAPDGELFIMAQNLGKRLYCFGHSHDGYLLLCVAEDEKVYLVGDGIIFIGGDLVSGLSNVLLGIVGRRFVRLPHRIPNRWELEFSPEVTALLTAADPEEEMEYRDDLKGVRLPRDVVYCEPILELLVGFAGLHVPSEGPGIDGPRHGIEFDTWRGEGENGVGGLLTRGSARVGSALYPLGWVPGLAALLCLAANGRMYLVGPKVVLVGETFAEGLHHILLGVSGQVVPDSLPRPANPNWQLGFGYTGQEVMVVGYP